MQRYVRCWWRTGSVLTCRTTLDELPCSVRHMPATSTAWPCSFSMMQIPISRTRRYDCKASPKPTLRTCTGHYPWAACLRYEKERDWKITRSLIFVYVYVLRGEPRSTGPVITVIWMLWSCFWGVGHSPTIWSTPRRGNKHSHMHTVLVVWPSGYRSDVLI